MVFSQECRIHPHLATAGTNRISGCSIHVWTPTLRNLKNDSHARIASQIQMFLVGILSQPYYFKGNPF